MTVQFSSYVGVDWSGGGKAHASSTGLAVAEASEAHASLVRWHQKKRSRPELADWLASRLKLDVSPVCIGLDFAFGYPHGAMQGVFGASSWRELADRLYDLFRTHELARDVIIRDQLTAEIQGQWPVSHQRGSDQCPLLS
ncbi:hypothetical protein [Kaistia algarum]|uniref:hypothetical protein n=1 Tax=Kaistia algarum TaxID=2083279 RepID=UPI0010574733|nr:hypothetical protein [Kaistia algarum]MCX5512236.1 hypothetical protein [Kaistia algarum]